MESVVAVSPHVLTVRIDFFVAVANNGVFLDGIASCGSFDIYLWVESAVCVRNGGEYFFSRGRLAELQYNIRLITLQQLLDGMTPLIRLHTLWPIILSSVLCFIAALVSCATYAIWWTRLPLTIVISETVMEHLMEHKAPLFIGAVFSLLSALWSLVIAMAIVLSQSISLFHDIALWCIWLLYFFAWYLGVQGMLLSWNAFFPKTAIKTHILQSSNMFCMWLLLVISRIGTSQAVNLDR